jgi:hypothetical protein
MNHTMSASCSIEPTPKVRKLRALVLALFNRTAELRQGHNGQVKLLGQALEAAADLRNLLNAVVIPALAAARQQLEVVDDDQADVLLALQSAGAGAQCRNGQAGRVVNVQGQAVQLASDACELAEFVEVHVARADLRARDVALFGKHTGGELVGRHFQAEEGDRGAGGSCGIDAVGNVLQHPARGVEGDVGGKRGLAHARTAGEDDEVGAVHAAHPRIDLREAGGDAGQSAAVGERRFGDHQRFLGRVGEGLDLALAPALFGNLVELGLGALDLLERLDVLAGVERAGDEVTADPDQAAQQREVVDLRAKSRAAISAAPEPVSCAR